MDYEAFLQEKERVRTLPVEEQKAFYEELLETEKGKTAVRLQAYFCYALLFYHEGDFKRAREILEPFVVDYQSYGYMSEVISCFNLLGVSSHCEGEFQLTRYFYGKAIKLEEENGIKTNFSNEYNNIALSYIAEQDFERALHAILLSEKYLPYSDDVMGAYVYLNMSIIYHNLNRLEEAKRAFELCTEKYNGWKYVPDDTLICGMALYYKLGDTEKYEAYQKRLLGKLDQMYASELMDACKAIFDCAMDAGDKEQIAHIVGILNGYMKKHPEETQVCVRVEGFKYAYAEAIGDREAMLQALQNRESYYRRIISDSEKQRVTSLESYTQTNRQLQQAIENEAKANRAKTQFLANMSHDIRTPMNAIVGITNLMEHAVQQPDKLRDYLQKIQLSSRHMMGLVNDLLDMTRIESGASQLSKEPMNLAEQVEQMGDIIRPQTEQKGQRFDIRVHAVCHENLIGDATRLRQVILNALTNAVKYTPQGGTIILDIEELVSRVPDRAQYRFTVTDNGMGMEPELIDRIFEPFARGEDSVVNKIQGTGLGMSIAKSIVDLMGGMIQVYSKPEQGSRVEVTLGFKIDGSADAAIEPMHILLVSDDDELSANLLAVAQDKPVSVCRVRRDGAAGMLQKQKMDIVLLSGSAYRNFTEETARQLRGASSTPVRIFGLSDGRTPEGEKRGLDGEISAPFFLTKLEKAISRLRGSGSDAAGDSALKGLRFLCAEDNDLNAEILTAMLEIAGASCVIYANGKEIVHAFESVQPGDYDAILMDVQMPVMNGYDATRAIRNGRNPLGRTIPIMAMTANAFSEDIQKSIDAGMDAHLSKPVDIAVLEKTVRKIMGK